MSKESGAFLAVRIAAGFAENCFMKSDVNINVHRSFSEMGYFYIYGDCRYEGLIFRVSVGDPHSRDAITSVRICVISPKTKMPLQFSGAKRRAAIQRLSSQEREDLAKGRRVKYLDIAMDIELSTMSDIENIENRLRDAIVDLYNQYYEDIVSELRSFIGTNCRSFRTLYYAYHRDFIRGSRGFPRVLEKRDEKLRHICSSFDRIFSSKNKDEELRKYFNGDQQTAIDNIRLAASFVEFCRYQGAFSRENPFARIEQEYGV